MVPMMLIVGGVLGLIAAVFAVALILLKRKLCELTDRQSKVGGTIGSFEAEIDGWRSEIRDALDQFELAATPVHSATNVSVRAKAIRLGRTGLQPDEISRALQLPQTDIALLLKVNQLALKAFGSPNSEAGG